MHVLGEVGKFFLEEYIVCVGKDHIPLWVKDVRDILEFFYVSGVLEVVTVDIGDVFYQKFVAPRLKLDGDVFKFTGIPGTF